MRPRPNNRVNLESLMSNESEANSSLCSSRSPSPEAHLVDDIPENVQPLQVKEEETVKVCLRLRPHLKCSTSRQPFKIQDNVLLARNFDDLSTERQFTFSQIYGDSETQAMVYENCIRQSITGERGATFLTYGTSGSGKTYTLYGNNGNPGIIPRAIEQIFMENEPAINQHPALKIEKTGICFLDDDSIYRELKKIDNMKRNLQSNDANNTKMKSIIRKEHSFQPKNNSNVHVFIWVSFVEIYNENVYDLLAQDSIFGKRRAMKILSNEGNAYVKDLTSVFARNSEDAYHILQFGLQSASYGSTDVNRNSSRSHSIFTLTAVSYCLDSQQILYSAYKFCDLAGSERLKKTGTVGDRLKEAQKINTSLMVLGRCLETVHKNQKTKKLADLVPVRDSKLTMLIQSALLGKEKLTMIVNLYPTEEFYEENLNVLNFSSIAKQIVLQKKPTQRTDRATRYSFFLAQATSSPLSRLDSQRLIVENESLRQELDHQAQQINVYREQLAEKDLEIQLLKRDLFQQELQLRNELVDDFETYSAQREVNFKTRLEQACKAAIVPFKFQISQLEEKNERLKALVADMECDEEQNEAKLEEYEKKLKKCEERLEEYERCKRKRRLSL
ncbi:kinesin-like protein subito isoform X2 [Uranotaenia lowii]|nr:kinesin-like protein subito isoform X2 [Uranotaenia lowii]